MELYYYNVKSPIQDSFFGRLKINGTIDRDDFIKMMKLLNPQLETNDIELHLGALITTAQYILAEGKAISISDFIRLAPVLKGSFASSDEHFNDKKHSIKISCQVNKTFLNNIRKNITIERIERPVNSPDIHMIRDLESNENCIRLEEATRFVGNNFQLNDCTLSGLELHNSENPGEMLFIKSSDLVINRHTDKELLFTFRRSFMPPAWLTERQAISVKLIYKEEERHIEKMSLPVDSYWRA